jgi:hypothetical protein
MEQPPLIGTGRFPRVLSKLKKRLVSSANIKSVRAAAAATARRDCASAFRGTREATVASKQFLSDCLG